MPLKGIAGRTVESGYATENAIAVALGQVAGHAQSITVAVVLALI